MLMATLVSLIITVSSLLSPGLPLSGRNSIEGRVTASGNVPVDNALVFLLNDTYGQVSRTYTDGSGRYAFRNIDSGNYYVQVEPNGTGFERQTQRIEVNPYDPTGRGSGEIFTLDFTLKPSRSAGASIIQGDTGGENVVFVQNVPPAAKEAYQQAAQSLKKDDLKTAELDLVHAIELFPDYFDALETLGTEYVKHSFYDSAAPLLTRAVEVNKDAWRSYYGLGVSLIGLNRRQEGIEALRNSVRLNPKAVNAAMRLGLELAKEERSGDEAIKLLSGAVQTAGKLFPDAYLALASLYSKRERYGEAADALEAYLQASPSMDQRINIKQKIDELRRKQKESKSNN